MAQLFKFQEIAGQEESGIVPKVSAISVDSLTLIVSNSSNEIQVYQRLGVEDQFSLSGNSYKKHEISNPVTALALQNAGVHAASGDSSGSLHVWRTDSPDSCTFKKFAAGKITSLAISIHYLLVSFFDDSKKTGCMALIRKGINLHDDWVVIRKYDGIFSRCVVAEHGTPLTPHILFYENGKIVHQRDPGNESIKPIEYTQELPPWCMRQNTATAKLLVFGIATHRSLLLWAPKVSNPDENPMTLKLSSKDFLKFNQSLVMSSVVASSMFLVSIYGGKLHVIRVRRSKDIEREKNIKKDLDSDESECSQNSICQSKDEDITNDQSIGEKEEPQSVVDIITNYVKDPEKKLNLDKLADTEETKDHAERCDKLSEEMSTVNHEQTKRLENSVPPETEGDQASPPSTENSTEVENPPELQESETPTTIESTGSIDSAGAPTKSEQIPTDEDETPSCCGGSGQPTQENLAKNSSSDEEPENHEAQPGDQTETYCDLNDEVGATEGLPEAREDKKREANGADKQNQPTIYEHSFDGNVSPTDFGPPVKNLDEEMTGEEISEHSFWGLF